MIEVVAAIARWFQLAANLILLGSCVFLAIASTGKHLYAENWIKRLEGLFPWLIVIIPLGLVAILITTIAQATGNIAHLWQQDVWIGFLLDTRVGQTWMWRVASAFLLASVVLYIRNTPRAKWKYVLCAVTAAMPLIISTFASHSASDEINFAAILPYAVHLVLAGVWFGALPAFLLLIFENYRKDSEKKENRSRIETLGRFSSIAFPVMLLIVLTGTIVGDRIFDGHYAAIVATPYGWLLSSKILILGFILLIAARVRSHWLPLLANDNQTESVNLGKKGLRKWVGLEFFLALFLVLLATIITNTTPVKYVQIENWPFPFRFSINATWNQPNVAVQVWIGVAIALSAIAVLQLGKSRDWKLKSLIGIPAVLLILGFAIALPPLAIQAFPETYRRPLIPFDTTSVVTGGDLYEKHCAECHGVQGKGNGIKSRTLSTKLPDLLTESHTTEHTPGDFYNWISYGMANTDMPGYVDKLTEEERWDLVNYIHALSRGYQARPLTPEVVPGKAYVKPPVFHFGTLNGNTGVLQDFRGNKSVLLVIFSWPQSKDRLEQLKAIFDSQQQDIAVLAVPVNELSSDELSVMTEQMPFPIITQNAHEIVSSYALSRRTLTHPDIIGRGTIPEHMEFLIDRQGYMRARWIPSIDESGWSDMEKLKQQISILHRENSRMPVPEDFVQ